MRPRFAVPAALAAALVASASAAQPAPDRPWTVEGRLDDGDPRDAEERHYDEHRLHLEAGRRYRISASSDEFDTVLQLFRAGADAPVAENDDYEGLNSRISYSPADGGEHVLRIFAYSAEGSGSYAVTAQVLPPLPPPSTRPATSRATTQWQIWEGELAASDPDGDESRFDDYLVTMGAGETRLISLESGDFDVVVWLLRPDDREGEPIDMDDDSGTDFNALLGFRAEEGGDYIVRVGAYGTGRAGAYRLRISDPLTPPPPVPSGWTDEPSDD